MDELTRRDFLARLMAAGAAVGFAGLLAACSKVPEPTQKPVSPNPQHSLTPAPPPTSTGTPPISPSPSTSASVPMAPSVTPPDLVIVRNAEPAELVTRALSAIGGMGRFLNKGADVIIKPNICVAGRSFEYAATTNPWTVGALVKLAREAGAGRVRVMDLGFSGGPEEAYRTSGIRAQVESNGGEMEIMSRFKYISTPFPEGRDLKKWDMYDDILKADLFINVPVPKTHGIARLTLGMKNLMGCIRDPGQFHLNIGQRVADLASRVRPRLTIIDAVRIMTAGGPTGGNLRDVKKLDTVAASTDFVAADAWAATLFGLKPFDISYVKAAAEMGLGQADLSRLRIEEIDLARR